MTARRQLFPQCSLIYLRALLLPRFWKGTIQKLNGDTLSSLQAGPVDLRVLTNRLGGRGVRTEGRERKQLSHLHLKYHHINDRAVSLQRTSFPLSPQSPAGMDIVEICCNALRGLGSQTWPGAFGGGPVRERWS